MTKESMKIFAATFFILLILLPLSFLFLIMAVVLLDISFGIAPPTALILGAFVVAILYGIFVKIGHGFKKGKVVTVPRVPPKRLLRVEFLQEKGKI